MALTPIRIALSLAGILLAGLILLYFSWRDNLSAESLGHSVSQQSPAPAYLPCERRGDDRWSCEVFDGTSISEYRVEVDGRCWTGRLVEGKLDTDSFRFNPAPEPQPRRLEGCLGIWDQILK